ncbi:MAG: 2-C-methyl-D-erythritol 2,4-cyclodiphosphate synthase [Spirochaetia bacterium]|nr:2-C-methyl-D-erythritol 2,4-cyclodiphosphate synthase [Spirochaetia bacterium]
MNFRIGNGFDVHRTAPGSGIYLGGVFIETNVGLAGHSDADVLIHAICDAIYGALGSGDIGEHFPDSAPENKGRASSDFLRHAVSLMQQQGYTLGNLDATIICETPKITPYKKSIAKNLALLFDTSSEHINIKATTTEKLGFTGRGEGIAAQAVVFIQNV